MRSHFSNSSTEQKTPSARKAALAWAISGATAMLTTICSAQVIQVAADDATNSTYSAGWNAGQNGGFGFGAWSFDGTDPTPPGQYQGISSSSPLGTAWTLLNHSASTGLATAGRAIPGGLQPGQTFETVIDNPMTTQFFRGWRIFLNDGTTNVPPGSTAGQQIAVYHFEYFNYGQWTVGDLLGDTGTTLFNTDTAVAGMKLDVTLTSETNYSLTMTPLGNPTNTYTQSGSLKGGGPINWIQYQLFNTATSGLNDPTNNFEISYMKITEVDTVPPEVACRPAPNPSGKIVVPNKFAPVLNPNGYYEVLAKDNLDPNPQIFIMDTGSGFVAGPFNDGDVVRVKHTGGTPSAVPGSPPVVAVLSLSGDGLVLATDASGNVTSDANGCLLRVSGSSP